MVIGVSNLGSIIRRTVSAYGPKMRKTDVPVADVNVSIFSGKANIKDLFLGKTKGVSTLV